MFAGADDAALCFTPIFASGQGSLSMLAGICCGVDCLVGGLNLAATHKNRSHRLGGAALALCGIVVMFLSVLLVGRLASLGFP